MNAYEDEGIACGPCSAFVVDAEIVVEDEGMPVYLHAQWVDLTCEDIYFEATTESIYDLEMKIQKEGEQEELGEEWFHAIDVRNEKQESTDIRKIFGDIEERYSEQYTDLVKMIQSVLDKEGIDIDLNRDVTRDVLYYNLDMIISLGYRIKSSIATQFRRWATERLSTMVPLWC